MILITLFISACFKSVKKQKGTQTKYLKNTNKTKTLQSIKFSIIL